MGTVRVYVSRPYKNAEIPFSDKYLQIIAIYGCHAIFKIYLLTATEMVVIKNLYIFKYSRIAAINEYFLTAVVTQFNIVYVFGNHGQSYNV